MWYFHGPQPTFSGFKTAHWRDIRLPCYALLKPSRQRASCHQSSWSLLCSPQASLLLHYNLSFKMTAWVKGGSRIHRLFSQPPVVKDFWIGSLFLAQNCHGNPSLYGCCRYLLQQLVYAPTEQLLKSFVQLLVNEFELALLGALTVVFFLTLKRELISHSLPWRKLLSGIKRRKAKVQDTGWEVLLWGLSPSEPCCQDPQEEINFPGHDVASHTLLLLSNGLLSSC